MIAALRAAGEAATLERLFAEAGRTEWLTDPPREMIAAADAARLHAGLRRLLPPERAEAVLREAGRLTGRYLLANRIPALAQVALKLLPRRWAARALARAIGAHAWTFVGDGRFDAEIGRAATFTIFGNPLCREGTTPAPACVWHAAVLKTLFAALVTPQAQVVETECEASGGTCCRFRISWFNKADARTRSKTRATLSY